MAVKKKTHSLTFYPLTETADPTTKKVPVPTEGTGVSVQGQLTPMKADAAFQATGIELNNPHLFLCDIEDVASVPIKANIQAEDADGNAYVVTTKPNQWSAITAQSFAEVILEQVEYRA